MNNIRFFSSTDELALAAAQVIVEISNERICKTGQFTIALSGGSTPSNLYRLLATDAYRSKIDWKKVFIFWGDERCVPFDDPQNNSFNAQKLLLDLVNIPQENVFPVPVNLPPSDAAKEYDNTIKAFFKTDNPYFDLILLGMGANGHTASLFPHTPVLKETTSAVREVYVEEIKAHRITFTAPLINASHHKLFLVSGAGKTGMFNKVTTGAYYPEAYPAQLIHDADWFVTSSDSGSA